MYRIEFSLKVAIAALAISAFSLMPTLAVGETHVGDGRQGGDGFETAFVIDMLPFYSSGTTVGYNDTYDVSCPQGDAAPEVFYSYSPGHDSLLSIDLCGSNYDTKVYVVDTQNTVYACNSDYYSLNDPCGQYVSRIEEVMLLANETYYIVVDGNTHWGQYEMEVLELFPCNLDIPGNAVDEGEPTLHDGYSDQYNGGCGSPEYGYPVQAIEGDSQGEILFHGVSGWYDTSSTDQDWFSVEVGAEGQVDIELTPEHRTVLVVFREFSCDPFSADYTEVVDRCEVTEIVVPATPGQTIWLGILPRQLTPPMDQVGHEYDYLLSLSGLQSVVAAKSTSLSELKSMFRP